MSENIKILMKLGNLLKILNWAAQNGKKKKLCGRLLGHTKEKMCNMLTSTRPSCAVTFLSQAKQIDEIAALRHKK